LRRHALNAAEIVSLLELAAVTITASAPKPPVDVWARSTKSAPAPAPQVAPWETASSIRAGSRSEAITRHPFARSSWTVSWPMIPSPITPIVSPSVGSARRTPCMAMAPSVTVDASPRETPGGTLTARFTGTAITSAWLAMPAPAQATRSPTANPTTSSPISTTTPAAEYPVGRPAASLPLMRLYVRTKPWSRASSSAFFAWWGCFSARRYSGMPESSTPVSSVPTLTQE
jgi:hypothetical protein